MPSHKAFDGNTARGFMRQCLRTRHLMRTQREELCEVTFARYNPGNSPQKSLTFSPRESSDLSTTLTPHDLQFPCPWPPQDSNLQLPTSSSVNLGKLSVTSDTEFTLVLDLSTTLQDVRNERRRR